MKKVSEEQPQDTFSLFLRHMSMGIIRRLTPMRVFAIVFVMNKKAMTLRELLSRFPDNDSCKAFLERKRWPDGVIKCPRCGEKAYRLPSRPFYYLCKSGKESVDKKTGEVFICQKKN